MAPIEEHLLLCTQCQETLARVDTFIATMKSAAATVEAPLPETFWSRWLGTPRRIAIAFGTAALVVGVAVAAALYPSRTSLNPAPVALVALQSFRGDIVQTAPAGRPLELRVPASDLPARVGFRLEVVTSSGAMVWNGDPGDRRLLKGLTAGAYFVRLYDANGELQREYSLRVE